MKRKLDSGETRMQAARASMAKALTAMPAGARLGLLLYGHRRAKDCLIRSGGLCPGICRRKPQASRLVAGRVCPDGLLGISEVLTQPGGRLRTRSQS